MDLLLRFDLNSLLKFVQEFLMHSLYVDFSVIIKHICIINHHYSTYTLQHYDGIV